MAWRVAVAAAKASGATDTLIESTSNDNRAPFRSVFGNGSLPTEKPHTAIATKRSAAVLALRRLPRKPVHIKGSKIRKPRRLRYGSGTSRSLMRSLPTSGLYATIPIMLARIETTTDSNRSHLEDLRQGSVAQSTTTGAITKVPAASASHQVSQVTRESGKLRLLARMNPAKTMVELIIVVGAKEMIANFTTVDGGPNDWGPLDQRSISHVPATAARRVPIPTEPDSKTDWLAMW